MKHGEKRYVEDPGAMMAEHPNMVKWVQAPILILGVWLITSSTIFQYTNLLMLWSDVFSGIVIIGIAVFSLQFPKLAWVTYVNALVRISEISGAAGKVGGFVSDFDEVRS